MKNNDFWNSPFFGILLTGLLALAWVLLDIGCAVRRVTGLPCPGCGLTRALLAALQGDFAQAFQMHPLFWLLPLIAAAVLLLSFLAPEKLHSKTAGRIGLVCLAIYIGVYAVRMFLFYPNHEPMTYDQTSLIGQARTIISQLIR